MTMAITCCNGCVPPKRTPTCKFDGTCDKYAIAKQKHDEEKQALLEAKRVANSIQNQKNDCARRALRHIGIKYGEHR